MKLAPALLALAAGGCLPSVGGVATAPECQVAADCPAAGQVCDENLCWGDVPPANYAAILGPPTSSRSDLVVTELPQLTIPDDGGAGDLLIQAPVRIGGRVHLACGTGAPASCDPTAAISAAILVTRPSRITGGPDYSDAATSDPGATGDSFTLGVPRLGVSDMPYTVTVTPSDADPAWPGGPTPAQLVPPLVFKVDALDDMIGQDVALGSGTPRSIAGRVLDVTGAGVAGVKVTALGRFDAARPLERVSTIGVTDLSGNYTLEVAQAAYPVIDLVGSPAGLPGLTLRLHDVQADQVIQSVPELRLPAIGKPIAVTLPVLGTGGNGQATPVAGATVTLTTQLDDPLHPSQVTTYEVSASTDPSGNAPLTVLPGSAATLRPYHVRVNPPPSSEFASVYDQAIGIGAGAGVLGELDLPHRVAITGALVDADGNPAAGVAMTAQPALRLSLKLDAATQAVLSALQPPSTTTLSDGSFTMWVDPNLAGVAASYDLACVPPAGSRVPRWTLHDVGIVPVAATIAKGAIQLPRGRHVRAHLVDEHDQPVAGAELRLYKLVTDATLCSVANLPADCVLPAVLAAVDHSDDKGVVRLVVADPR